MKLLFSTWMVAVIMMALTVAVVAQQQEDAQRFSLKERLMKYREMQYDQQPLSLEAVREHHDRRLKRLEELVDERKQSLEDHHAGRRLLKDDELKRHEHQVEMFQRKLTQMRKMTDEDHRETLETEKNSFQQLKRLDYLDF